MNDTSPNPAMRLSTRHRRRTGRTVRLWAAGLAGAALALAAPLAASAHVGVDPSSATSGSRTLLTFAFSHACEGSPTTALRITMPDGLDAVSPEADALWDIDLTRGEDGLVDEVVYTATEPIENGLRGTVSMSVLIAEDVAGPLAFPVQQQCIDGVHDWNEIAQHGQDPHELDAPAPVLTVTGQPADAVLEEHGETDQAEHGNATTAAASTPLAIALGAGGAALGASALIVAMIALRRRA